MWGDEMQRIGMVIGIKPSEVSRYRALHADSNPGVRELLVKYHIHNFSIFIHKLDDGREYLFGYYEYCGADYAADMAALGKEPENLAWLQQTDPCQMPLAGETAWATMEMIYHNA
jgi:L-rhamnose mutarotase